MRILSRPVLFAALASLVVSCSPTPVDPVDDEPSTPADPADPPPPPLPPPPPPRVTGTVTVQITQSGDGTDGDGLRVTLVHNESGDQTHMDLEMPGERELVRPVGEYSVEMSNVHPRCETPVVSDFELDADGTTLEIGIDCIGPFVYQRWHSTEANDVWWVDAAGNDAPLFEGGYNVNRGFSPDGQSVLVEHWDEGACGTSIVGTDGSVTRLTHLAGESITRTEWSPDGTLLAGVESPSCAGALDWIRVVLYDSNGNAIGTIPQETFAFDANPTWSPDGQSIAFTRVSGVTAQIVEYGVFTGETRVLREYPIQNNPDGLKWSPDGSRIQYEVLTPQHLHVLEVATGEVLAGPEDEPGLRATWHPDSRRIFYSTVVDGVESLRVFDTEAGEATPFLPDMTDASSVSISGDGRYLLYHRLEFGRGVIYLADIENETTRAIHESDEGTSIIARFAGGSNPASVSNGGPS